MFSYKNWNISTYIALYYCELEGDLQMCDSGFTEFMYWAVGAAGAQLYINSVNPESHIWQYFSICAAKYIKLF